MLVVDDQSPDATVNRARSVREPNLEVRVNESNLGLGDSVLAALETIDTPYVALLNSDDLFHPDRIAKCREVLDADPDAQLVATGLHLVDPRGHELKPDNVCRLTDGRKVFDWVQWYERILPQSMDPELLFGELLRSNFLATSTNLVCRTEFLRAEAESIRSLEFCLDMHLFLAAAQSGGLRYLPDRLAAYRLHPNNTVWFAEEERWNYFLEVNRVAVTNLRRYRDRRRDQVGEEAARAEALAMVADGLVENTEIAGFGAFLCELLGGYELDGLAHGDEKARSAVQRIQRLAARAQALRYATEAIDDAAFPAWVRRSWSSASLGVARVLAEIRGSQAGYWRGSARWAQRRLEGLESRLRTAEQAEERVRAAVTSMASTLSKDRAPEPDGGVGARLHADARVLQQFVTEVRGLIGKVGELETSLASEGSRREQAEQRSELAGERQKAAEREVRAAEAEYASLREQLAASEAKAETTAARAEWVEGLRAEFEQTAQAQGQRLTAMQQEFDTAQASFRKAAAERDQLQREVEDRRITAAADAEKIAKTKQELEDFRDQLGANRKDLEAARQEAATVAEDRDRLRSSREFKVGYAIWNKTPLFAKSRRLAKRVLHRERDRLARFKVARSGSADRKSAGPDTLTVAAGTTWEFPTRWHTFVYQELQSMQDMLGARVNVIYGRRGDASAEHEVFRLSLIHI